MSNGFVTSVHSFNWQLLLEEKLNCSTLSQEVGVFVELVWTEALGSLSNILTVPVSSISLNDVRMSFNKHTHTHTRLVMKLTGILCV